ncbi:MAG: adenylate/guanylate cyclase domain-containing protein [Bacteroidota bacterium]|nr:adenylate/guanylate cyclase domain-containing protein [Bacteroidota bacterium]
MSQNRQLAAIMFTDIVGYTALMGEDEQKTFELLNKNRELQKPIIEQYNGRWIKELGDGVLVCFTTVSDAVNAAVKIQEASNITKDFQLRIGIHLSEVVFENEDVFGDGVNIAYRIQCAASPGCIYISESVYHNVSNNSNIQTMFVKEESFKNVKVPVRIYEVMTENHQQAPEYTETDKMMLNPVFEKSIAVLPFVNMSNDPEQEYFTDGISEAIINTLVQIKGLKVAGRTSAFSFKNKTVDLRTIGEKLNVNTILEGSVRKSGNRIRITAQLIEVSTGFQWWSKMFDRELDDVFIIQDEIANAILEKLQITLAEKTTDVKDRIHTTNIEAYQLYLKGMSLFYKRGVHMFEGLKCFENALIIEPDYALALAGVADSYTMLCLHSYLPPEEAWPKATAAINRAVQFGPDLAEVHNAIATIALLFERNWEKAGKEYLKAVELNPHYLQAHCWYALFYLQVLKPQDHEALKHARLAIEKDPLSSYAQSIVSHIASNEGLHEEAISAGKRSVEYDEDSFTAWYYLAYSNHCAGNIETAIQAYKQAINISGRHNWALTSLLSLLMESSDYQQVQEAKFLYKELQIKAKISYVSPSLLATASAAIGNQEEAVQYLLHAIDRHDPFIIELIQERQDSKALRSIPEFKKIMIDNGLQ